MLITCVDTIFVRSMNLFSTSASFTLSLFTKFRRRLRLGTTLPIYMSTSLRRKCRPRLKLVSKAAEPLFMEAREGVNNCLFGSLLNILDFLLESNIERNIRLSRVLQ